MKKKSHYVRVFSRHPSHATLRADRIRVPVLACVRFGSTTVTDLKYDVEINTPDAVRNSSNKSLMKQCFDKAGVKSALQFDGKGDVAKWAADKFPIVAKHIFGSRGRGNTLIKTASELSGWMQGKTLSNYIFEKFYSYSREYRLHMTADGCFYTCRKVLKNDTPAEQRWYRNDANSNWIVEENELFDKPVNWDEIVEDCRKALVSVGLDVGAFDVRVQSAKDSKGKPRTKCDWIVLESNSAPSFGDITLLKYREIIPKIVESKLK